MGESGIDAQLFNDERSISRTDQEGMIASQFTACMVYDVIPLDANTLYVTDI